MQFSNRQSTQIKTNRFNCWRI